MIGNILKKNIAKITDGYIIAFVMLMLIYLSVKGTTYWGEYASYTGPAISLIHDHDLSISQEDIESYKQIIPEWKEIAESRFILSGQTTRNGKEELPWYFPTYGILCVPYVLLLMKLQLPVSLAFSYTNLTLLAIVLLSVKKWLHASDGKKFLMILLLSINPEVFYLCWALGEVTVFCFLALGMIFWHNGWYKRAAVAVSIAGTINPAAMGAGFVMIAEYLFHIYDKTKHEHLVSYLKDNYKDIIRYGCCYIISLIPLGYFYYHTGYINPEMTISTLVDPEGILMRAAAYILDLNFGLLPYYAGLLILESALLVRSIIKKDWNCIRYMISFMIMLGLYSVHSHINCGMAGMARYVTWSNVLLLFAAGLYADRLCRGRKIRIAVNALTAANLAALFMIIFTFGPWKAENAVYVSMTPIAEKVLDLAPWAYHPLASTFCSRVYHVDGGYDYQTPIIYYAQDGYIRKILSGEADLDRLASSLVSEAGYDQELAEKIYAMDEKEGYISLPAKYKAVNAPYGIENTGIIFGKNGYNADLFVSRGIAACESWGSWSSGDTIDIHFRLNDAARGKKQHCTVNAIALNEIQHVAVSVNGEQVFNSLFEGGTLEFDFYADQDAAASTIQIRLLPVKDTDGELGIGLLNLEIKE